MNESKNQESSGAIAPSNQEPKKEQVEVPEHLVFAPHEVFPMKGFNFRFVGYAKGNRIVFEGMGRTAKSLKKQGGR